MKRRESHEKNGHVSEPLSGGSAGRQKHVANSVSEPSNVIAQGAMGECCIRMGTARCCIAAGHPLLQHRHLCLAVRCAEHASKGLEEGAWRTPWAGGGESARSLGALRAKEGGREKGARLRFAPEGCPRPWRGLRGRPTLNSFPPMNPLPPPDPPKENSPFPLISVSLPNTSALSLYSYSAAASGQGRVESRSKELSYNLEKAFLILQGEGD
eukprot:scaffold94738_cov33-Tisochrysis_lutea.AAC.2